MANRPNKSAAQCDIGARLGQYDGKNADVVLSVADEIQRTSATVDLLIDVATCGAPNAQVGATWLLKYLQDEGMEFTRRQVSALLELFSRANDWQVDLHLLQMLADQEIPKSAKETVRAAAISRLGHPKPFVRAWAYNALAVLASQCSEYRDEVEKRLDAGRSDPAASVRARLRNIESNRGKTNRARRSRRA